MTSFPRLAARQVLSPILLAVAAVATSSCVHRVIVKTDPPGARVRILGESGKAGSTLGTTPLDIKSLPGDDVAIVELEKDGHLPKMLVIPKVKNATITATVKLQPLTREFLVEKNRREFAAAMNANFAQLLKLQSLVLARNKTEVEKLDTQMRGDFDDVSLFHSLMGNYYFLQSDFKKARGRYQKALALDPYNEEARSMLADMRK
jgi:hypothetical protein